jgi:predicted short-subunit dehydrogenase-like oxidoreductase (DUF2520 family)
MSVFNISFAGAGRVAGALCRKLHEKGYKIDLIVSENESSCRSLASETGASWSTEPVFPDSSGLIIVAVPDHRLSTVLSGIRAAGTPAVVHTAGSFGLDVFPAAMRHKGVLYPLQTFSRDRSISFVDLPFFIEASDSHTLELIRSVARATGGIVNETDLQSRQLLHIAAVFACNFTNHMLDTGSDLSGRSGYDLSILKPLITETIEKAFEKGTADSQTGPAIRGDKNIIEKHLDLLSFSPRLRKLYHAVSESIAEKYNIKK